MFLTEEAFNAALSLVILFLIALSVHICTIMSRGGALGIITLFLMTVLIFRVSVMVDEHSAIGMRTLSTHFANYYEGMNDVPCRRVYAMQRDQVDAVRWHTHHALTQRGISNDDYQLVHETDRMCMQFVVKQRVRWDGITGTRGAAGPAGLPGENGHCGQ